MSVICDPEVLGPFSSLVDARSRHSDCHLSLFVVSGSPLGGSLRSLMLTASKCPNVGRHSSSFNGDPGVSGVVGLGNTAGEIGLSFTLWCLMILAGAPLY